MLFNLYIYAVPLWINTVFWWFLICRGTGMGQEWKTHSHVTPLKWTTFNRHRHYTTLPLEQKSSLQIIPKISMISLIIDMDVYYGGLKLSSTNPLQLYQSADVIYCRLHFVISPSIPLLSFSSVLLTPHTPPLHRMCWNMIRKNQRTVNPSHCC